MIMDQKGLEPIMYLREAALQLKRKDNRSVERWCNRHTVKIFYDDPSRKKYIIRAEFEIARLKKIILFLKIKYKDKWFEAFKNLVNSNVFEFAKLDDSVSSTPIKPNGYAPKGNHEKSFLSRLTEQIDEL